MCKRVLCLMFVCALGLPPVASAELVGWWKLNDGTGTVVKDSSDNGLDGNFVGNPKWVEGMNGTGGLELDGNSWVDFGAPPQTLFTGTMPLSIALWINPTNLGTVLAGAGHDRAFLARNQDWAFKASGPYARLTTPGVLDYNAQKTVLKVGEWQHIAVTFKPGASGTAGVAVFYLDGIETDRVSSAATNGGYNAGAATAGGPVLLGNNQWSAASNPQFYSGRYDMSGSTTTSLPPTKSSNWRSVPRPTSRIPPTRPLVFPRRCCNGRRARPPCCTTSTPARARS